MSYRRREIVLKSGKEAGGDIRPLSVLHFVFSLNVGGGSGHVYKLATDIGGAILVHVLGGHGTAETRFANLPHVHSYVAPKSKLFFRLIAAVNSTDIDVLHLHGRMAGLLGRLAVPFFRKRPKILYTVHGFGLESDSWLKRMLFLFFERTLRKVQDFTVFVSKSEQDLFRSYIPTLATARDRIVYNYVDAASYQSTPMSLAHAPPCRLVYIGRFAHQKGVDLLLNSLAAMSSTNWLLDLYGEGPQEREYGELATALGLGPKVRFCGVTDDSVTTMRDYDAVILPSRFEGLPYILIEAIVADRPIICTPARGIDEFIDDRNGYKAPEISSAGLATAIDEFLLDYEARPDAAHQRTRAARSLLERQFNKKLQLARLLELYRS